MKTTTLGLVALPLLPLSLAQVTTITASVSAGTATAATGVVVTTVVAGGTSTSGDPFSFGDGSTSENPFTFGGGEESTVTLSPTATVYASTVTGVATPYVVDGESTIYLSTQAANTVTSSTVTPSTRGSGGSTGTSTRSTQATFTGAAVAGGVNLGLGLLGVVGAVVGAGL